MCVAVRQTMMCVTVEHCVVKGIKTNCGVCGSMTNCDGRRTNCCVSVWQLMWVKAIQLCVRPTVMAVAVSQTVCDIKKN